MITVIRRIISECLYGQITFFHLAMKQMHSFYSNLTIQNYNSKYLLNLSICNQQFFSFSFIFDAKFVAWNQCQLRISLLFLSHFFAFKCFGQLITKDYCSVVAIKKKHQVSLMILALTVLCVWHNHWKLHCSLKSILNKIVQES